MRLSEAFEIASEDKERGCRFVKVGRKTEQSERRVPYPAALLPYLPKKIAGPLFRRDAADPADAASKRLNRFLRKSGITDPAKVIHSFRHRAQDRLRAAECPQDIRWAILGHERKERSRRLRHRLLCATDSKSGSIESGSGDTRGGLAASNRRLAIRGRRCMSQLLNRREPVGALRD